MWAFICTLFQVPLMLGRDYTYILELVFPSISGICIPKRLAKNSLGFIRCDFILSPHYFGLLFLTCLSKTLDNLVKQSLIPTQLHLPYLAKI